MSIKLEWDVSEAPRDDEVAPRGDAHSKDSSRLSGKKSKYDIPPEVKAPVGHAPRRPWWLVGLTLLAVAGGGAFWYLTQAGWQTLNNDVAAAVSYEDQQAARGAITLLLNVQDRGNIDWLAVRRDEALARQPAPLPSPVLNFGPGSPKVADLTAIDADFVSANVSRAFSAPDGQSLTFTLPQFYRRGAGDAWLRSAPPGSFWGNWLDWQGNQLVIRYSERDAVFVNQAAPVLDRRLADACAVWTGGCPSQSPVRLYLSGFVGSLEYDPLLNVEVRIAPGDVAGQAVTPSDYFLSVPSPQIAGIPTDDASRSYLTDYLAVRLLAALARHTSTSPEGYVKRTTQAIQALDLSRADPGYLVAGQKPRSALAAESRLITPAKDQQGNGERMLSYGTTPGVRPAIPWFSPRTITSPP